MNITIIINIIIIIIITIITYILLLLLLLLLLLSCIGPALVSLQTNQGALEQATGRILRLQIEGPCTEGYCWIRIQN